MTNVKSKTADEHLEDLIVCHDEIKQHPFRMHFQDDQQTGSFRAMCEEYRRLIYRSTEIMISLCYYCSDSPLLHRDDLEWVHDFRSFLLVLHSYYVHQNKANEFRFDTPVRGSMLTYREILSKTGITDINTVMIFLDKYIGYLHRFIETKIFDAITAIEYEAVTKPHNGYYYKHLTEMHKTDGVWKFDEKIQHVGTTVRQDWRKE